MQECDGALYLVGHACDGDECSPTQECVDAGKGRTNKAFRHVDKLHNCSAE